MNVCQKRTHYTGISWLVTKLISIAAGMVLHLQEMHLHTCALKAFDAWSAPTENVERMHQAAFLYDKKTLLQPFFSHVADLFALKAVDGDKQRAGLHEVA